MNGELFGDVEYVLCDCGHIALDHHAVDRSAVSGGCFGKGSGFPWSPHPKCACTRTASEVLEV